MYEQQNRAAFDTNTGHIPLTPQKSKSKTKMNKKQIDKIVEDIPNIEKEVLSHIGDYIEEPYNIIESYFRGQYLERLVRHQIESYNHFVNYQIQRTIQMFNPVVIHSENDYRCPIEQGEQLFSNLKRRNIKSAMMRFPAESHELSRSGKPIHRKQRFEGIIDWHKKHLT